MDPAPAVRAMDLTDLYTSIAGADSDVSGEYPGTVQELSDAMHRFWGAYDAWQASLDTLPTVAGHHAGGGGHDEARREERFQQKRREYRRAMALHRSTAQDAFDRYTARVLDGDRGAARAYKRDFAGLLKSMMPLYKNYGYAECCAYGHVALRLLGTDPGTRHLKRLYTAITGADSDYTDVYQEFLVHPATPLPVPTLHGAMTAFQRHCAAQPASGLRCAEFHATIKGYLKTERAAYNRRTDTLAQSDALWTVWLAQADDTDLDRLHRYRDSERDRTDAAYRHEFVAVLKSMVPYLELVKAEAFAHHKDMLPDVQRVIHGLRAARANPFVL